jgi:predicted ATPase
LLTGGKIVAITSMGGIGKTVLASALAHDPEMRQAFPDGLYWLTVGQKTDRGQKTGQKTNNALLDLQAGVVESVNRG